MKILIAMRRSLAEFESIDSVLDGTAACAGTDGAIIRVAGMLADAGIDVTLSNACEIDSTKFPCINHSAVEAGQFDYLVVHQSHWDGTALTFGNQALTKTFLWLQNRTNWAFISSFFNKGGKRIICPSVYHANIYRALPQWRQKVAVIYNSYCSIFTPALEPPQPRLLFIGAITPIKGFVELMEVWSYLVQQQVNLHLAIAGSISIHKGSKVKLGPLGVAEADFENKQIIPWLKTLPEHYQPHFLGALSPVQLRTELARSWGAVVNPSWSMSHAETFCIAAVDAQACDRTVFSVANGALTETIYSGDFKSLAQKPSNIALGKLIIDGLSKISAVEKNGQLAGEFVRSQFSHQVVSDAWIKLLSGQEIEPQLPRTWDSFRSLTCDAIRWSGTGAIISRYR